MASIVNKADSAISSEEESLPQGNIIVVDDNPASRTLLGGMLRSQGYEVRSFPLGPLALAAAAENPPDLMLVDVNMPQMDGYAVCEQLQSSPKLAGIPVIFLGDPSATEDKMKGFRSGGVDYISRPFQFEHVHARIETHLKLWRAQRAEHDLVERTLDGAVATLWELMRLRSLMLA
ncbi:MAG TPA: response regulator, partial [Blastocatellia bacterium]|nr:response regulator [Blastocatellia bacterium]